MVLSYSFFFCFEVTFPWFHPLPVFNQHGHYRIYTFVFSSYPIQFTNLILGSSAALDAAADTGSGRACEPNKWVALGDRNPVSLIKISDAKNHSLREMFWGEFAIIKSSVCVSFYETIDNQVQLIANFQDYYIFFSSFPTTTNFVKQLWAPSHTKLYVLSWLSTMLVRSWLKLKWIKLTSNPKMPKQPVESWSIFSKFFVV